MEKGGGQIVSLLFNVMKDINKSCSEDREKFKQVVYGKGNYPFYLFVFLISLVLIALFPIEAAHIETQKGWFLQPYISPLAGLTLVVIFSGVVMAKVALRICKFDYGTIVEYWTNVVSENRIVFFTGGLFYIYIISINKIGFFLSTLIFVCTLLYLSRLLDWFWLIAAFVTTVLIVLIFRVAIGLWLEDVWLYGLFAPDVADFLNRYM